VGSIGGGGSTGEVPGDGQRRDSGGGAAAARVPAQYKVELSHACTWELRWGQGKSFELSVDYGHERRRELTGRRQWRAVANGGDVQARARRRRGFIGRAVCRGGFVRPSSSTGAMVWARGGGVVGASSANGGLGMRTPARASTQRGTGLCPGACHTP
jgi:hypothetical protein